MSSEDRVTRSIADEIERYLQRHPNAADSADGIRAWWLSAELSGAELSAVVQALEWLETRGVVVRSEREGLATVFSSPAQPRRTQH